MAVPDIGGAWFSELGKLIYIVTQLHDRFVWRVIHGNGVTETGIGLFEITDPNTLCTSVNARWNFHGGDVNAAVRSTFGRVICVGDRATRIEWDDRDHFRRVGVN